MAWGLLVALVAASAAGPDCALDLPLAAERELLERHAPLLLLAPGERARPASVEWLLARSEVPDAAERFASLRSWLRAPGSPPVAARTAPGTWAGSADPGEWVVYGHAYGGEDGGVLLQYWLFYPFNDFHGVGDHEGDWEHVTVRLDAALRPAGAWLARHDDNAPGAWRPWDRLAREDGHPVVLAARGSHASYARPDEGGWLDATCATVSPADAAPLGCTVWRTWHPTTGGVLPTGPRADPRPGADFVRWPGRWGARIALALTGPPPGPAFQPGWCAAGREGIAAAPLAASAIVGLGPRPGSEGPGGAGDATDLR